MARYRVSTSSGHTGQVVGVHFVDGAAEIGHEQHAQLAYFRQHGYTVEPIEPVQPAPKTPAKTPAKS